jgi:hypothetical protein
MPQGPAQEADTRTLVILAFSATAGVLIEIYDLSIFGFAVASAFPQTFFPTSTPGQALLFLSYLTFGAGPCWSSAAMPSSLTATSHSGHPRARLLGGRLEGAVLAPSGPWQ